MLLTCVKVRIHKAANIVSTHWSVNVVQVENAVVTNQLSKCELLITDALHVQVMVRQRFMQLTHYTSQRCTSRQQTKLTRKASGPSGMMVHSQLSKRVSSCFCINMMLQGSCSLQPMAFYSTSRASMSAYTFDR